MRTNDIAIVVITLGVGFVLGVFSTLTVYTAIAGRSLAEERREAEERLEEAIKQRDEAQAKIVDYLEHQKREQDALEQGAPSETPRSTILLPPLAPREPAAAPEKAPEKAPPAGEGAKTPERPEKPR
jgi:Na+-transporting methylmalonyl-CoA/oxaloacetate decarboxylase gamma subunit